MHGWIKRNSDTLLGVIVALVIAAVGMVVVNSAIGEVSLTGAVVAYPATPTFPLLGVGMLVLAGVWLFFEGEKPNET